MTVWEESRYLQRLPRSVLRKYWNSEAVRVKVSDMAEEVVARARRRGIVLEVTEAARTLEGLIRRKY